MRKKIRKMDCIEYLSVQAPLDKVNMLEDKQSRYIHDFAKKSEYNIVGKIRRNGSEWISHYCIGRSNNLQ